jgi:hypothetical protein
MGITEVHRLEARSMNARRSGAAVLTLAALLGPLSSLTHAQVTYFNDQFSTFAPGNLVGQNGWTQSGATSTLPLQVTGGQVVIPFGQTVDNQDAYKNFTGTDLSLTGATGYFFGWRGSITNAPVIGGATTSSSFFAALSTNANGGGFANYRVTAIDAGGGTYTLGVRITGQAGDPFTFGAPLPYNTPHTFIGHVLPDAGGGMLFNVYVNPTSSDLGSNTPYLSHPVAGGTPPTSIGSLILSQFASATVANVGALFDQAVATDNFSGAYIALVPEPTSLILVGIGAAGTLGLRRRNRRKQATTQGG